MQAKKHTQEEQRLQALARYQILDTDNEAVYDGITRLIAQVCDTPIAVINLIDRDRQWFKSEIGLGVRETPLDVSICAHAILQPGVFIVPDTTQDDRFRENPLVIGDPLLRFYAGALLESSDGYPLGTLCVLDYQPRELTPEQKDTLQLLAQQVMAQIELRQQMRHVEELNARLKRTVTESHHRIKNHFQSLAGVVEMQLFEEAETVPASSLHRIGQHVRTLSLMHDLLTEHHQNDTASIAIPAIFEIMIPMLQVVAGSRQQITWQSDDIALTVNQSSSFMLLVNELVSNAIKHGAGTIAVDVQAQDGTASLQVCDNGEGFPPKFDPVEATNVGLELILSLAKWDLKGSVTFANAPEGGAQVTVTFPMA